MRRLIYAPGPDVWLTIPQYIKAFRTAKANPEVEFKQSFNCWWPCKGSVIVKEFHAAMHHRINQGLSYSDRGIVNLFNCQRS